MENEVASLVKDINPGHLYSNPSNFTEFNGEVYFYASGHRYDVFVSEMSLFVGTEQAIIPNFPENTEN